MKTLLTIEQQNAFLSANYQNIQIEHKWSARGYGNSKLINLHGDIITKRGGCGYDRFGTVIGDLIELLFPNELNKLAKRFCKDGTKQRKTSKYFYGLSYNVTDKKARLDGGCGSNCMKKVLNAIGFELVYLNETKGSVSGSEFYEIRPVSKHIKQYVLGDIK